MASAESTALEILGRTTAGAVSPVQAGLLSLLLERRGDWIQHRELVEKLKAIRTLPRSSGAESARVQIQRALRAIERKVHVYLSHPDAQPELRSIRIERMRGKGVRLVANVAATQLLAYQSKTKSDTPDFLKEEVLARLTLLERKLDDLTGKIGQLINSMNEQRGSRDSGE